MLDKTSPICKFAVRMEPNVMYIVDFGVTNYKSFRSGYHTPLSKGFNVIVGRNNVGKTAMIEGLGLRFGHRPHRSPQTVPHVSTPMLEPSVVNFLLVLERLEFVELVSTLAPTFYLPTSDHSTDALEALSDQFLQAYESDNEVELSAEFANNEVTEAQLIGIGTRARIGRSSNGIVIGLDEWRRPIGDPPSRFDVVDGSSTLPILLARTVRDRIYTFRAERLALGESPFGFDPILAPDASNLPRALNHLQTNPVRHQRFNKAVNDVFPDVTQVTVQPTPENNLRILVWSVDPESEREDLAVPLSESGTGIGQALAILYVVMTSEFPRIIIVDEPQSFLHPGAVQKLFAVMRRETRHEHQYVVTTHSPSVVTSADPRTILLIRKDGSESSVELIDVREAEQTRLFLAEIGARLADVFGADKILWVEGPTEERCFPLILRHFGVQSPVGMEILGVRSTGELEGRNARAAFEIYQRLSAGRGLLPPAVAFVFDREGRTDRDRDDLSRQARRRVHFLPRRMYENYLLHPEAIAAVAGSIEGFVEDGGESITAERVEAWLEENRWRAGFFDSRTAEGGRTAEVWRAEVHGARVLADLFNELSEARVQYEKVAYGVALTNWLLEHSADDITELAAFLQDVLRATQESLSY